MGRKDKRSTKTTREATSPPIAPATAKPSFDLELDALFSKAQQQQQQSAPVSTAPVTATPSTSSNKRKRPDEPGEKQPETQDSDSDSEEFDEDASLDLSEIEKELEEQGLQRGDDEEQEEFQDDDVADAGEEDEEEQDDEQSDSVESSDDEAQPPVHESLATETAKRKEARLKRTLLAREEETTEVRDQRSIFVGNVPLSALQSKSLTRDLKKQVIAMSPYPSITRVDALRYRSVAFSVPTGDYSAENSEAAEKKRARSRAYKEAVAELEATEDGLANKGQVYLNPKQKRKVAYINQDINEKAKSVNAYITLDKLSEDDYKKLATLQGSSDDKARRITPSVLAALTAARLDDTVFEGRHLRVDLAAALSLPELVTSGLDKFLSAPSTSSSTDPFATALARVLGGSGGKSRQENSRTLFVGNLDFEADEEDVRALFEGLVREERGPPPVSTGSSRGPVAVLDKLSLPSMSKAAAVDADDDDDAEASAHLSLLEQPTWVSSVRLIRDPATQMGKGFGYIRFMDEECVDELMAIWESDEAFLNAVKPGKGGSSTRGGLNEDGSRREFKRRVKLNKRALRLARCKTTGGGKGTASSAKSKRKSEDGPAPATPRSAAATQQTPPRTSKNTRRRSMGAPTPGGTSPSIARSRKEESEGGAGGGGGSSSAIVANPPPKRERTSEDLTRLALKRNDPERQAKRLAKKDKKRSSLKEKGTTGGKKDKVKLDVKKAQKDKYKGKGKHGKRT